MEVSIGAFLITSAFLSLALTALLAAVRHRHGRRISGTGRFAFAMGILSLGISALAAQHAEHEGG